MKQELSDNIQKVNRIRTRLLDYVYAPTQQDIDEQDFQFYVYCYETKLLIGCRLAEHYLAIQEHLIDYLERNNIRTFDATYPLPIFIVYFEFTKEEIALMDNFIETQLLIYGTDRTYDTKKALY